MKLFKYFCSMKWLVTFIISLATLFTLDAQQVVTHEQLVAGQCALLHEADLIFVVNSEGNAITQSTQALGEWPIDHVAVFHRTADGMPCVIQAVHKGVCIEPLDSLLADEGASALLIGRVSDVDAKATIRRCMALLGKPYDHYFAPSDSAIYCSELVQKSYVDAKGNLIFAPIPMSFHASDGSILPYWTEHYGRMGSRVPEGAPGTNPAELSRRPQVTILYILE